MEIIKSKKAVFFTFIAIFILILIIAVVTTRDTYRYRERSNAIASRVRTMNDFIEDFEKDLERELYIGGYRAILSMNAYVRQEEDFVNNFDTVFQEILINGSINGSSFSLMHQGAQGADIRSWLDRTNEETNKMNMIVDVIPYNVYVKHTSPWTVEIAFNATVYISDLNNLAYWEYDKLFTREILIIGFEDPLYTIGTQDKVTTLINVSDETDYVVGGNADNLEEHLLNSFYVPSSTGPSFLMRFEGNLSDSVYGIESMVNLAKLDSQGIPIYERSVIDYVYFGVQSTSDYCNVTDMPDWFRIDDSHEVYYEVDTLTKDNC